MAIDTNAAISGLAPFLSVPLAASTPVPPATTAEDDDDDAEMRGRGAKKRAVQRNKDGKLVDDDGNLVDEDGNRVDKDGNPIDEDDGDDDSDVDAAAAIDDPKKRARVMRSLVGAVKARTRASASSHERARIGAILRHPNAAASPGVAARMAFHTSMSARDARQVLDEAKPAASSLSQRMATVPQPKLGAGSPAAPAGADAVASLEASIKRTQARTPLGRR